jgi:hypothetical protein
VSSKVVPALASSNRFPKQSYTPTPYHPKMASPASQSWLVAQLVFISRGDGSWQLYVWLTASQRGYMASRWLARKSEHTTCNAQPYVSSLSTLQGLSRFRSPCPAAPHWHGTVVHGRSRHCAWSDCRVKPFAYLCLLMSLQPAVTRWLCAGCRWDAPQPHVLCGDRTLSIGWWVPQSQIVWLKAHIGKERLFWTNWIKSVVGIIWASIWSGLGIIWTSMHSVSSFRTCEIHSSVSTHKLFYSIRHYHMF